MLLLMETPERSFCHLPPTQISDAADVLLYSRRRCANRPTRICHWRAQIARFKTGTACGRRPPPDWLLGERGKADSGGHFNST